MRYLVMMPPPLGRLGVSELLVDALTLAVIDRIDDRHDSRITGSTICLNGLSRRGTRGVEHKLPDTAAHRVGGNDDAVLGLQSAIKVLQQEQP